MTVSQGTPTEQFPTTEQVRKGYVFITEPAFDAWLAGVEREAAAKALTEAADEYKSGQLTGIFMGRDDYTKEWLRARAAEVREARP